MLASKSVSSTEADGSKTTPVVRIDFPKTDVALVVEGERLYVNKDVLSSHSPVFKALFEGEFKEKGSEEIELPEKKYSDVVLFLRSFYPNMQPELSGK